MTVIPSEPTVTFRFIGPDTGCARLIADLEIAGANNVRAEPEADGGDRLNPGSYSGQMDDLAVDQARAVGAAYLATTTGQRLWVADEEIDNSAA